MPKPQPAGSTAPFTLSKSEFAELCHVDKSRVSQWLKDGRITSAALAGTGRSARIIVDIAQQQLKGNLDPYQMMATGNGARTKLDVKPVKPKVHSEPLSPDAEKLMAILSEIPSTAAWDAAEPGNTTQRAFDTFANLRLNMIAELRRHGFVVDESVEVFAPVNWPGLATEMGLTLIQPAAMEADWERRRHED